MGTPLKRRLHMTSELLEFRPWMLAFAVFLACAIGIAIMETSRENADMWAQARVPDSQVRR